MIFEALSGDIEGKVIFVEGLPGSGKSTLLHDINEQLREVYSCECYKEETKQPLDLFRQAVLPACELEELLFLNRTEYPEQESATGVWLKEQSYMIEDTVIIAYTQRDDKCGNAVKNLSKKLREYDIGDGRVSFEVYADYHKYVWRNFAKELHDCQRVYLSEGALFHNQLLDLVGFYELSDEEICSYYRSLISELGDIDILVEYIDVENIGKLIASTNQSRPGWQERLDRWLQHAPWAIQNHCRGEQGVKRLYEKIRCVHKMLMDELSIPTVENIRSF